MTLNDLDPRWYSAHGDQRHGLTFNCPHCPESGQRLAVAVHVDGTNFDPDPDNPQQWGAGELVWAVAGGDSFGDLSLTPSIDASGSGHWHGHITDGAVR